MDIEYLLFLQRFRNGIHDFLTPLMEGVSLFAITMLVMIPVFIYWVVDKKKGLFTLTSFLLCRAVNAIVKLTVCAYRPWIRDSRVIPAGDAIRTATGYSFPSGHTISAGTLYGGLSLNVWRYSKSISIFSLFLILLTGFSRNYLGVHTPQDVFVGIAESFMVLFIVHRIFDYVMDRPKAENVLLITSFVLGWLGIIYITFKSYPMDYVGGKLLVDPQKMMNDGYSDLCSLIAFPIARFVERKWVRFKPVGMNVKGIIVGLAGLVPLYFIIEHLKKTLDSILGSHWGHFSYNFILVFYCIALYPIVIRAFGGKTEKANENVNK